MYQLLHLCVDDKCKTDKDHHLKYNVMTDLIQYCSEFLKSISPKVLFLMDLTVIPVLAIDKLHSLFKQYQYRG